MDYPIKAQCQCGQVSYLLYSAPKKVIACHCRECQKLSSAPYSVTAMVDSSTIEFTGELLKWERTAESGNPNVGYYCPNCGNRIYQYNPDSPDMVKLKLKPSTKDVDSLFEPSVHVWVSEKQSWLQLPDGVISYPKSPQ